ncbi:MAG: hypothetical protein U0625_03925 [Phycisphaerales bacterium]
MDIPSTLIRPAMLARHAALCIALGCATASVHAGGNLIVNGNFENPTLAGISSDYVHTPNGNTIEGSWWVHPWNPGGPWWGVQHTPGGAGAMSVNGDNSSQAGQKRVWYQAVSVTPGRRYRFSAWALATAAGFPGYSLRFALDGAQVSGTISPSQAFLWEQFSTEVVAIDSVMEISIVNVSGITFPNDFMLDDLGLEDIGMGADLNGDGAVNGADLGLLLAAWGPCANECAADLDNDGAVTGSDLGVLLAGWTG